MDLVIPQLYASAPRPLALAPSIAMRAFLCKREHGNVLVYASTGHEFERPEIESLGGSSRHYLNHAHEAEFLPAPLTPPIMIHERDGHALPNNAEAVEVFSGRHVLGDDFEAIPTLATRPGDGLPVGHRRVPSLVQRRYDLSQRRGVGRRSA